MPSLLQLHFWGLPVSTVAGIFAAVGASIVVLYILKLRRRSLEVPFVGFWQEISRDASSSRLFRNLRRWLSLLLALLIAGLLVLALGDPRLLAEREPNRLIILLDVSASMDTVEGGEDDAQTKRFDLAKQKAKELIARMGASDRAVLIAASARPRPLTGLTDRQPVLVQAIEKASTTGSSLDLTKSLRVAADLAAGSAHARVVLLSDGGFVDSAVDVPDNLDLAYFPIGKATTKNVAITAMSARLHPLDPRRNQIFVEMQNVHEKPARVELQLQAEGRTLSTEMLTLEPGARRQRMLDDLGGLGESLSAHIIPQGFPDALDADNHAHLILPKRKRLRVGVVSEGNLYLQAALLLDEHLSVQEGPTMEALGDLDQYDALIFDGTLPAKPPSKPAIYIDPDGRNRSGFTPLEVTADMDRPYVDKQAKSHPLLRWVALGDINIAAGLQTKLEDGDVMVAGDRRGPLLVDGTRSGQRFFALLFDPRESDLPLRAAWPLLLISMLDNLVPQSVDTQGSCTAGQPCFGEGEQAARIFDKAGIVALESGEQVAVNVDPREANLQSRQQIDGAKATLSSARVAPANDRLWIWLVALALLLLTIEWWTLQRRRTV